MLLTYGHTELSSNRALTLLLKDGVRLERPNNCSTEIYNVMLECWNENPNARPKFCSLRVAMEQYLAKAAQNGSHSYFLECRSRSPYIYEQANIPFIVGLPEEDAVDAIEMTETHAPSEWLNVATPQRSSPYGLERPNSLSLRPSAASSLHSVFSETECVEVRYVASPIYSVHTSARQSVFVSSEHIDQDCRMEARVLNGNELSVQLGRKLSELSSNKEGVAEGSPLVTGNTSVETARQD